ncbi:unnamed protein product, partial [Cyprideis torosa]
MALRSFEVCLPRGRGVTGTDGRHHGSIIQSDPGGASAVFLLLAGGAGEAVQKKQPVSGAASTVTHSGNMVQSSATADSPGYEARKHEASVLSGMNSSMGLETGSRNTRKGLFSCMSSFTFHHVPLKLEATEVGEFWTTLPRIPVSSL